MSAPEERLLRQTAGAIAWNYLSFGLGKLLVLLTTAILARLLTPEEFGIVGFATLAVSYFSVVKDFGMGAALIQRRGQIEEAADTVFTFNLLVGVCLTLATAVLAPLVATYFREPLVTPLLRLLGMTFAINALGAVHIVRLQRQLDFRRKLVPDLGSALIKGVVSIGMAMMGYGVWSLVAGQLAGTVVAVIIAWIVLPWRPRVRIVRQVARSMLRFGTTILGIDALTVLSDNMDYLIVGRLMGNVAMGLYTLAYRLPELLVFNILWVLAAAIFPAFSKVQDEPDMLRRGFLVTLRFVELVAVPLCLGLILAADPLVRVAFGEQWLEAIPIVRILATYALLRSIGSNVGDVYKAMGRPDILFKLGLLNLLILVPALLVGSRYGLVGVAWGHVAAGIIRTLLRLAIASRLLGIALTAFLSELRPAFMAGSVLTLFAGIVAWLTTMLPPLSRLLLIGGTGVSTYLAMLWLMERRTLAQFRAIIANEKAAKII